MVNTKTFVGSIVIPPDGYVLTYNTVDGYWEGRPLPNPGQIMSLATAGASPYNVGIEDIVIVPSHVGVFDVNLPNGLFAQIGRTIAIKDGYGNASINPINLQSSGPLIDGYVSYALNTDYGCIRVVFDGVNYIVLSKF